jgi:orotate phosphoribosyltransferase
MHFEINVLIPPGATSTQRFVVGAIQCGAIRVYPEGKSLKSGRVSPHFFNSGIYNDGALMYLLANAYAEKIASVTRTVGLNDFALFGPAYKGIALVNCVAVALFHNMGIKATITYNRKEAKDHGEGGILIGAPLEGKKVIILDDVITDGQSKRDAVAIIKEHGGDPVACFIAFDRQEVVDGTMSATQQFKKEFNIPVHSIAGLSDLITVLETFPSAQTGKPFTHLADLVKKYREKYGAKI